MRYFDRYVTKKHYLYAMNPVDFRRRLHRRPELSFRERETARFIAQALDEEGIRWRAVAGTGILASIEGRGDLSRAVVLRADIDALPIEEMAPVAWRSENTGAMHACGHDLHAAVLYGVLRELAAAPDFKGTVLGLFQPGEECNPGGASLVLAEEPFAGYDVRAVVGEHVDPDLEVGQLGFRAGKYMASNDELRFRVEGTGGHAALRERLQDPVRAAAELVVGLTDLNAPERIVSVGRFTADGATNVVPDTVLLEGTMRTYDETVRQNLYAAIRTLAADAERRNGVHITVDIDRGYPCVVNDADLTALAAELARSDYEAVALPLRPTAEDFGHYGTKYPSLFYRLGVGAASGRLHTAHFRPDEGAIPIGIDFMRKLALKILSK